MFNGKCKAVLVALLIAIGSTTSPFEQASAQPKIDDFVVTMLGTGFPTPGVKRFGPSTLIKVGNQILLFDIGRGASQRIWQTKTPMGSIDATFITHLHSDHIVGLPDVWLTGWLPSPFGRRTKPMKIWGPAGTGVMLSNLEKAYEWDIRIRIADQRLPAEAVPFQMTEVKEGVVYEQDGVRVTAFEVDHGELIKPCFGYRVDYDGRSVVISGDTKFDENLIKFAQGTDLLIHQVAMAKDELLEKSMAVRFIIGHHTTPEQVGTVFTRVKPKAAVLYHIVLLTDGKIPAPTEADVVQRAKTTYSGDLIVADDLMQFVIAKSGVTKIDPIDQK